MTLNIIFCGIFLSTACQLIMRNFFLKFAQGDEELPGSGDTPKVVMILKCYQIKEVLF